MYLNNPVKKTKYSSDWNIKRKKKYKLGKHNFKSRQNWWKKNPHIFPSKQNKSDKKNWMSIDQQHRTNSMFNISKGEKEKNTETESLPKIVNKTHLFEKTLTQKKWK